MPTFTLFLIAGAALLALGFYGLTRRQHLIRKILALNIAGNGIFLLFIATAERNRDVAGNPDPVPQAMVLTGIVVAVCATAFALGLAERLRLATGEMKLTNGDANEP
ncbi:MAG: NADH-quinone oxidoreductase subunit K [Verrucomicrobiota bacterium]